MWFCPIKKQKGTCVCVCVCRFCAIVYFWQQKVCFIQTMRSVFLKKSVLCMILRNVRKQNFIWQNFCRNRVNKDFNLVTESFIHLDNEKCVFEKKKEMCMLCLILRNVRKQNFIWQSFCRNRVIFWIRVNKRLNLVTFVSFYPHCLRYQRNATRSEINANSKHMEVSVPLSDRFASLHAESNVWVGVLETNTLLCTHSVSRFWHVATERQDENAFVSSFFVLHFFRTRSVWEYVWRRIPDNGTLLVSKQRSGDVHGARMWPRRLPQPAHPHHPSDEREGHSVPWGGTRPARFRARICPPLWRRMPWRIGYVLSVSRIFSNKIIKKKNYLMESIHPEAPCEAVN